MAPPFSSRSRGKQFTRSSSSFTNIHCGIHCTKFECILKATLIPTNRTRGACGGLKLPRTLVSFRHCLAEPRQPRKKNTPCISDLAGVKFLLKVERTFFFGVLPSRSRAGGGTMRTKFWQSNFLGKGFAKTSADLFLNSDVANGKGGVWGGIFHLLFFLFWGNSGLTKNRKYKFDIVPLPFYYFSSTI